MSDEMIVPHPDYVCLTIVDDDNRVGLRKEDSTGIPHKHLQPHQPRPRSRCSAEGTGGIVMIVKAHRSGSFYAADNGNWCLAGPSGSTEQTWAWIDAHSAHSDHNKPPSPAALAPTLLQQSISRKTRCNGRRAVDGLRLTDRQANWWHGILKHHIPTYEPKPDQMEMGV
ncbi:hypothetical protein [Rhizobium sp. RAF56]|uniref:hypothetical protein n=1 Tax=Rhizobium sp. RAF56 TaxID=3233062 RepID=UPI003F9CE7B5